MPADRHDPELVQTAFRARRDLIARLDAHAERLRVGRNWLIVEALTDLCDDLDEAMADAPLPARTGDPQ